MRDVCLEAFEDKDGYVLGELTNGLLTTCCQDSTQRFKASNEKLHKQCAEFTIRTSRAPEPENIVWENLGLGLFERIVRSTLSLAFTLVFLIVGFSLIIRSMNYQEKVKTEFPILDGTPYIADPFACTYNCTETTAKGNGSLYVL